MGLLSSKRRFRPLRTGGAAPLGQLERAVMGVVWRHDRDWLVGEVHGALSVESDHGPPAYTTVKTTMERLASKEILHQSRNGKAYRYRAALSEAELERRIVTAALDRLVEQFPQAVASFFVQPSETLTPEQLALLLDAVERRRATDHPEPRE